MGGVAQRTGQSIIVEVRCFTASIADQKDAIVMASRMAVGDVGVGAFNPPRKVGAHKQIENAVNAVGRNPLAPP